MSRSYLNFFPKAKKSGFTLVELMVTMSVMAILTTVFFVNFRAGNQKLTVDRSAQKLVNDLRLAEEMAMSAKECTLNQCASLKCEPPMCTSCNPSDCQQCSGAIPQGGYGVFLNDFGQSNLYVLYADTSGNEIYDQCIDAVVKQVSFDPGVLINYIGAYVGGSYHHTDALSINFKPPDPIVKITYSPNPLPMVPEGQITLYIRGYPAGPTQTVRVNKAGLIYISALQWW